MFYEFKEEFDRLWGQRYFGAVLTKDPFVNVENKFPKLETLVS